MIGDIIKVGRLAFGGVAGLKKILKGGGIATGGAAVVTALLTAGVIPENTPPVIIAGLTAGAGAGINFLKVWLLKWDIHLEVEKAE